MKVEEIQDNYNNTKVWLVKISKCSHYYLNQTNCGQKLNRGYMRVTKRFLFNIGVLESEVRKVM